MRLVVDKFAVAKRVLAAHGWQPQEEEILEIRLSDKPGTLGEAASVLGAAGVNITYAFVSAGGGRQAMVFLAVSDMKKALRALRRRLTVPTAPAPREVRTSLTRRSPPATRMAAGGDSLPAVQVLAFDVGGLACAVGVGQVREVLEPRPVTPSPVRRRRPRRCSRSAVGSSR